MNQLVATRILRSLGCTYDVVDNGRKAVAACLAAHYDVILMDCHMPEMVRGAGPVTTASCQSGRWATFFCSVQVAPFILTGPTRPYIRDPTRKIRKYQSPFLFPLDIRLQRWFQ